MSGIIVVEDVQIIETTSEAARRFTQDGLVGIGVVISVEHIKALVDGKTLVWRNGDSVTFFRYTAQ